MSTPATPSPRHDSSAARPALTARRTEARVGAPAGWLLLLVSVSVFLVLPFFVAHGAMGRETSFRDAPFGILIGLAGIWMAVSAGRHIFSATVAGICGVGLLLGAILAPHVHVGVVFTEAFCGAFAVLVAAAAVAQSSSSS